jgi:hypothetical protein
MQIEHCWYFDLIMTIRLGTSNLNSFAMIYKNWPTDAHTKSR